mmetsp:Transcript_33808/g.49083  ORF Transcript_33808/g.49083 Transcript_33808/m.49083 type:complete len:176 (+) Transcript_33808:726-1253(+)
MFAKSFLTKARPLLASSVVSRSQPGVSIILSQNFSALKSSRPSFAAHGHHDDAHSDDHHHDDDHVDHGPVGPYDLKHHATYPKEAYFLGINPKEYKSEGFEVITIVTYILMFGILALTFTVKESDSFREWAIREAKAREEVREAGGEIEFGKYYSTPVFEEDEEDKIPKVAEAEE